MSEASLFPNPDASIILPDDKLRSQVAQGFLITKATFSANLLAACSYDLRIGGMAVERGSGREVDFSKETLNVSPGAYAGIVFWEKLRLPLDVFARLFYGPRVDLFAGWLVG